MKKPVQIPQHPFCGCVCVLLPNKDWHLKMRLDNETKENINWNSYQEWQKNYNNGFNNNNRILNISDDIFEHANDGNFINTKNPKNIKLGEIRLRGGGHE